MIEMMMLLKAVMKTDFYLIPQYLLNHLWGFSLESCVLNLNLF